MHSRQIEAATIMPLPASTWEGLGLIVDQHEDVVGETSRFEARQQRHFVEGQHHVREVAGIRDPAALGKADAVTTRACGRMRRGLDLGGYDLDGPKAVACFGAELGKGNGCFLRTFASIADDFDDVLRETYKAGTA